ncbi:sulfatase-like hydrolase/transferase [Undibacterium sp. Ji67W]|uniref:sulfatase-like hydrolase/transferase n=1 Tax=Undibacterium sp. Ji67W TaxID=3413042 RepID=UPI003BF11BB8
MLLLTSKPIKIIKWCWINVFVCLLGFTFPFEFVEKIDGMLHYATWSEVSIIWFVGFLSYIVVACFFSICLSVVFLIINTKFSVTRKPIDALVIAVIGVAGYKFLFLWLQKLDVLPLFIFKLRWLLAIGIFISSFVLIYITEKNFAGKIFHRLRFISLVGVFIGFAGGVYAIFWNEQENSRNIRSDARVQSNQTPVVLITIDTLSAKHMSMYGATRDTTPNLQAFANEATTFSSFYANGNFTTAGVASLMTGMLPWSHRSMQPYAYALIGGDTPVKRLSDAGYILFSSNSNILASAFNNRTSSYFQSISECHSRTFEPLCGKGQIGLIAGEIYNFSMIKYLIDSFEKLFIHFGYWSEIDQYDPRKDILVAEQQIESIVGKPFFSWVHLVPPHDPYVSPMVGYFNNSPRMRSRKDSAIPYGFSSSSLPIGDLDLFRDRYDESIRSVDVSIGQYLSWLKQNNYFDKALIIISADHGESFSHDYMGHGGPILTNDVIKIPLLIKLPKQHVAIKINSPAQQIDLMPTILDILGMHSDGFDGKSWRDLLMGGVERNEDIYSMSFEQSFRRGKLDRGVVALISGDEKYVHYIGKLSYPNMKMMEDQLYDLKVDPNESVNLDQIKPLESEKMLKKIKEKLKLFGGELK